jgi:hypothetical protein
MDDVFNDDAGESSKKPENGLGSELGSKLSNRNQKNWQG